MFKYDISVIVAVYNCKKYIKECINSLINQKFDLEKIQILLIDDGSTDNSYEICEEYKKKYNNITLLKHENHGVSYTRNVGIKHAEGKYIMIVDSDDFIHETTVSNLYNFMEKNQDIDISSYSMKLYKEGNITEHYRNMLYSNGTGIYDINEFPYLSQATINIIFRNKEKNNILYDENMTLAEDEKLNTNIIMQKGKIGFCEEATYFYRKHTESVTSVGQNPYYCFEQIIDYFNYLINQYEKNGILPKYIQNLIIHAIKWRISGDIIFPYYLPKKEFEEAVDKIKNVLQHVEIDTILNKINMNEYHKMYILKLKGIQPKLEIKQNSILLKYNNQTIYSNNELELEFNRLKEKNGSIYMLGYVKSPVCELVKPRLYIYKNNKKCELKLEESNFSYYGTNIKIAKFYKFECEVKIDKIKEYSFELNIDGQIIPLKIKLKNWSILNENIDRLSVFIDGNKKILTYLQEQNKFIIENKTKQNTRKIKKHMTKIYFKKNPLILISRKLAKSNKKIWIYCDRKGIFDNAYYQFKHDINKKDGVKRYFVIDKNEKDYKKYFTKKELLHNVIKKGSYIHKIMFLRCSKIITSFSSVDEYAPFKKGMLRWYADILKYDLIYLQHGVLYANLLRMYSKEYTEIEKVVVSSEFEKNNLINNYKYNEKDLICSGMPRFDIDVTKTNKQNKILFAPSWRAYLIGNPPINGKRTLRKNAFLDSKFYKQINEVLNDKELDELLEKNNTQLHFKLHPIFMPYKDLFKLNTKNIKLVEGTVKNEEYSLFITDLSSFQFDFTLLKTPMVYFIPDKQELDAGLHTYRKLDLPLEDAFGDIVYTAQDLINKIEYYLKNNFKIEKKYEQRMNNFFFKTKNCREKIYNQIK